jgi:hypothetical protein
MGDCKEEETTQHHRGRWFGFGVVGDNEHVLFAVFDQTKRDGSKIQGNSFDTNALKNQSQSVARQAYTRRGTFDREVAVPGAKQKGPLVGVARAKVEEIRSLVTTLENEGHSQLIREFCVTDSVLPGDYSSHAAIGHCELPQMQLSGNYIGKLRFRMRMDLANVFSEIVETNGVIWASLFDVSLGRMTSVLRSFRAS